MKQKTTIVAIITCVIGLGLTAAVFMGKLSGTEFAAAIGGVGAFATVLIGIFAQDQKK